jgi:hypothetical protein
LRVVTPSRFSTSSSDLSGERAAGANEQAGLGERGTSRRFALYHDIGPIRTRTGATAHPVFAVLVLIAALSGCDGGEPSPQVSKRTEASAEVEVFKRVEGCPVTLPNSTPPVRGQDFNYGDRHLAVAFWQRGRLVASRVPDGSSWGVVNPDGSIWAKLGWWRGAAGRLTIVGERLDARAPRLRADVPAGYGSTGFQATGLTFPTPGCWKVLGSVAGHDIEFVVLVTEREKGPPRRRTS